MRNPAAHPDMWAKLSGMATTDTPSWDEVMRPLGDSPLWPYIRKAATILIEHQLHEVGDFDSGISSSDINHTVFGVARPLRERFSAEEFARKVLIRLVDEAY
jgi:hypothetical protein